MAANNKTASSSARLFRFIALIIALITALGLLAALIIGCIGANTGSVSTVQLLQGLVWPLGLLTALAGGLLFAGSFGRSLPGPNGSPPHRSLYALLLGCGMFGIGVFLVVVTHTAVPLMAVAGLVFIALCWLPYYYSQRQQSPPALVRALLLLAAFIAGSVPGLVAYFILSLVLSDAYCRLTSSKCL